MTENNCEQNSSINEICGQHRLSACVPVLVKSYCVRVWVYVHILLAAYGWIAHYLLWAGTMAWRPGYTGPIALNTIPVNSIENTA